MAIFTSTADKGSQFPNIGKQEAGDA